MTSASEGGESRTKTAYSAESRDIPIRRDARTSAHSGGRGCPRPLLVALDVRAPHLAGGREPKCQPSGRMGRSAVSNARRLDAAPEPPPPGMKRSLPQSSFRHAFSRNPGVFCRNPPGFRLSPVRRNDRDDSPCEAALSHTEQDTAPLRQERGPPCPALMILKEPGRKAGKRGRDKRY